MNLTTYAEYSNVQRTAVMYTPTDEARWLAEYAPLVKRIVRRLSMHADGVFERDDLEQIGLMGLLEALRRYGEPDEEFPHYAAVRVRGAILDELRRQDWRPRASRQGAHRLRGCERTLRRELGREPAKEEVCVALGIDSAAYEKMVFDDSAHELMSFDALLDAYGDLPAWQEDGPESSVLLRISLEQALQALDPAEQRVIQLYYEYELTLAEIGAVLELTTARICQIHHSALQKMRSRLEQS